MAARSNKGRRITIVAFVAILALGGALTWLGRDHLQFLLAFESLGRNAQGYREYRHRQTGIVFVSLPGGTFEFGTPLEEAEWLRAEYEGWSVDAGVRAESVRPFLIAKYEVTSAEWEAGKGREPPPSGGHGVPHAASWSDCREFCTRVGLALPTEIEWEYACRAGTTGSYAGGGDLDDLGWYGGNSGGEVRAVGQKKPNGFGLHDMHGNLWEWCEDRGSGFLSGLDSTAFVSLRNPSLDEPDFHRWRRVIRGGGWITLARGCRSASRADESPTSSTDVGFRPVWRSGAGDDLQSRDSGRSDIVSGRR